MDNSKIYVENLWITQNDHEENYDKKTTKKTSKNIAALEAKYRQADFARLVYLDVMTNLADILHMPEVELEKLIHEACENVKEMKKYEA